MIAAPEEDCVAAWLTAFAGESAAVSAVSFFVNGLTNYFSVPVSRYERVGRPSSFFTRAADVRVEQRRSTNAGLWLVIHTEERGAMILHADFIPSQQEILRFCRINEIMNYQ